MPLCREPPRAHFVEGHKQSQLNPVIAGIIPAQLRYRVTQRSHSNRISIQPYGGILALKEIRGVKYLSYSDPAEALKPWRRK